MKDYSYKERLEKWGLNTLQERWMRGDLIETFQKFSGISNYDRHVFNIFS